MGNVYFELTREFKAQGRIVVPASGQVSAEAGPSDPRLTVDGLLPLIRIEQTQRAKDHAVIGGLARETDDDDPPCRHGAFAGLDHEKIRDLESGPGVEAPPHDRRLL